jgi:hypothetical protein
MAAVDGVLIDMLGSGVHDAPARATAALAGLLAKLSGRGRGSRGTGW